MANTKNDLISKILKLDVENRYYRNIVSRGKQYYVEGKIKYVFSPKENELIAVIQGTKKYYVYLELKDNIVNYCCSCPTTSTCKHEVAVMIYIQNHANELYEECLMEDAINKSADPDIIDYYSFIRRLLGPKKEVLTYTQIDFEIYSNRYTLAIIRKLRAGFDKTILARAVVQYFELLSNVVFVDISRNKECFTRVATVVKEICQLTDKNEMGFFESFSSFINERNIKIIKDILVQYADEFEVNHNFNRLVDILNNYVEINKNIEENCFNDVIILKANNLFVSSKEKFIEFANKYLHIKRIRTLLFKTLLQDENYDDIINIYVHYNNLDQLIYNEETMVYLMALDHKQDISEQIKKVFEFDPVYTTYKDIKQNLIKNKYRDVINDLVTICIEKSKINDKIQILQDVNDKDKIFEICSSIQNVEERINVLRDCFSFLISDDNEALLKMYQDDLIYIYRKNNDVRQIIAYLEILDILEMGSFYQYNLVMYLAESIGVGYFDRQVVNSYLANLKI